MKKDLNLSAPYKRVEPIAGLERGIALGKWRQHWRASRINRLM